MTKDEIITSVLGRVHRTGDSAITAAAQTEILAVQAKLEGGVSVGNGAFLPWFLFKDKTDISFLANVDAVDVPTGFLQEFDEDHTGALFVYDSTTTENEPWKRLERQSWAVIKELYPGYSDTLRFYDLLNDKFFLRPMPNFAGTLRLMYYGRGDSLASVSSNVWTNNAAELLICELGAVIANFYLRDAKASEKFEAAAAKEARRLYVAHIARLEAGRQRSRGED